MAERIESLIEQLASNDPYEYGTALAALIRRGAEAEPALRVALTSTSAQVRWLAAEGLGQVGGAGAADDLFAALSDPDGRVRSQAAVSLAQLHDPRAEDALIRTLNEDPDPLHSNLSRSAYGLIKMGAAVLPSVYPLLSADDEQTRMRAFWVVNQIVTQLSGNDSGWESVSHALQQYDSASASSDTAGDTLQQAVEAYVEGTEHD